MFKKTQIHTLLCAAWAASAFLLPATSQAAAGDPVLKVPAGQSVQISQTTALSKLVLGTGSAITAPDGYSVTLTVDGVGRPQEARSYSGDVVLTLTENISVSYTSSGPGTAPEVLNHVFRTGVYVNDGAYVPGKSVAAIVRNGTVSDTSADGVQIKSLEEKFNGILVEGASTYAINAPRIQLTGNGGNDFAGFGAAIAART